MIEAIEPYLYYADGAVAVDWLRAHTAAEGVPAASPQDQTYGARTYSVRDPQGYEWSFWQRLPTGVAPLPGWQEVRA